jgi:hypothetical protein
VLAQIGAPPSVPVGNGGTSHLPEVAPGGMMQARPAQQSPFDVQTEPTGWQVTPPSFSARQRSTPPASGTQGAPPQHSDENVHC